jgi:glucose-6-phosphate 1-dehydrogenase
MNNPHMERVREMEIKLDLPCILVIFGGTGDLTHRKLIPSLYNLQHQNLLPDNFAVVSVGRRDYSNDFYREQLRKSAENFSRFKINDEDWSKLEQRIHYVKFNFEDHDGYDKLDENLREFDTTYNTQGNRIYYLAVAPEYFEVIVDKLEEHNMALNSPGIKRIVIEKPFGKDVESAQYLNDKITRVFTEKNTYRIDHYLGKEMIQNIMVLRFANTLFESIWNNKYIDNIQISSSETVGVENRGGYYENSGALKDMIQNHMLQLLTLVAMEPPANLDTESIRDEKVKVLRSMEKITPKYIKENMVRGQYGRGRIGNKDVAAYREEDRVSPDSNIETFAALKLQIENYRWAGVPIYLRTGKRLRTKSTEIIIQFKTLPGVLYFKENGHLEPNLLVIKIQPREGAFFQFNAKRPGTGNVIVPVQMDFCQNCNFENNSPEAYERLLSDVIKGDSTLFTRWDEVAFSWKYVDNILKVWRENESDFPNYESGSWGPKEADELLAKDGRKWWNI